jgi:hypothetical protein
VHSSQVGKVAVTSTNHIDHLFLGLRSTDPPVTNTTATAWLYPSLEDVTKDKNESKLMDWMEWLDFDLSGFKKNFQCCSAYYA